MNDLRLLKGRSTLFQALAHCGAPPPRLSEEVSSADLASGGGFRAIALGALNVQTGAWVSQLTSAMDVEPRKSSAEYASLSGTSLRNAKSPFWYEPHWLYEPEYPRDLRLFWGFLVVLLNPAQQAVGFASVKLGWDSRRSLEVEIEEVWLQPKLRGQGLSKVMARAMVKAVNQSICQVEAALPGQRPLNILVCYAGYVFSRSGERFLRTCLREHEQLFWTELPGRTGRIQEKNLTYEARW